AVRPGQYAGVPAGKSMARSRPLGKKCPALRRARPAWNHLGDQRGRYPNHYAHGWPRGTKTMSQDARKPGDPRLQPGLGEVLGTAGGYPPPAPASVEILPEDLPQLERRLRSSRTLTNAFFSFAIAVMSVAAMVPLFSVLAMLIYRGGQRIGFTL